MARQSRSTPAATSLFTQALGADNVRPLTDTVSVLGVTEIDYQIAGTVTLFADAEPISTMAAVNAAAQDIALNLAARIQRDIVPSEIVAALSVPGAEDFRPVPSSTEAMPDHLDIGLLGL